MNQIDELKKRVESLEHKVLALLRHNEQEAKSSARRLRNKLERDTRQFELFAGLADDLEGEMTAESPAVSG